MTDLGLTDSLGTQAQTPQSSGVLDKISGIFSHPLVQGALATYLGAISTPRWEGLGGAIGQGGLAGLSQFGQAQQLRQQLPYLQARTAGEQAGAKLAGLQSQQLESQLAPLQPQEVQSLDTMIAQAKDPEEKAFFSYIKSEYQNRRLTPEEVDKHIETYNQSKRQADMLKAYGMMYGQQMQGQLFRQMGFNVPPSPIPPGMGGTTSAAAPAMTGSFGGGFGTPTHMLNNRPIAYSAAAGHWIYTDDGSPAG